MKTTNNQSIETLMGVTLVWLGASNLQGEYLLESYTKATKGKAEVWLRDKASGHIITMDLSRRTLGDLQQTGEHRTDAGTTIRIKQDAERPLWITIDNGVAGDIFKDWGMAVSDLQRHVYNTLQDCCGCEIHRESATRYQAYFEDDDKWEVSEVVPFDPTNPNHREAYEAQRDRLGLPELPAITEAEDIKVGDKVRHNLTGDRVATVTGIRRVQGYKWQGEITVYRLDFGESVKGPFGMEMNGGEYQREAFTLQEASEIKPKAAFQIGDRVERKSDGERGTVDSYDVTDGKLTYIVKYDRTQRRQSDGFEYLSEELNGNELQADSIESLTAKYAKQIEESALLGCGCMVGDGDETRKDSKCVKVRTAYKNDSHDAKDWTYCVSWYETTPIKGDADGQHQTLRECENGILLEQAAKHMAYFELMARKGWTLDEILYGKAA